MDGIKCNRCKSEQVVKEGISRGKQRYKCKRCKSRFVPHTPKITDKLQQEILELYTEGTGIRSIARFLSISHTTVIRHIRKLDEKHKPVIPLRAEHIEIDELYLYVGSKKRRHWLWLATCRETGRILGSRIGGRGSATLKKLYDDIAPVECTRYYTDGHAPYKNVLPKKKHQAGRGLTNMAEGINSAVRHYLARFRRRSKCYTKNLTMAEASVRLLIYRLNQKRMVKAA